MAGNRNQYDGMEVDEILANVNQGVQDNLDKSAVVPMQSGPMKKPDLLATIAAMRKPYLDVQAARNELEAKIKARDAAAPAARDFVQRLDAGLTAIVGTDPNAKAKLGLPKLKAKRQLTVEELASRAAKMRATRKLRGTLGSRQKEDIKATGDFTVTVGQPSAAPIATATSSAPTTTVQPAPVASNPAPTQPSPAPAPVIQSVPAPTGGDATAIAPMVNGATGPQQLNGAAH